MNAQVSPNLFLILARSLAAFFRSLSLSPVRSYVYSRLRPVKETYKRDL